MTQRAAQLVDFWIRPAKRGEGRRVFEIIERASGRVRETRASEHAAQIRAELMQAELDRYRAAMNLSAFA